MRTNPREPGFAGSGLEHQDIYHCAAATGPFATDCLTEAATIRWQSKAVLLPPSLAKASELHGKKRKGNVHASQDNLAANTTLNTEVFGRC